MCGRKSYESNAENNFQNKSRRYNYGASGRRDFVAGSRNKYQNHSDTYHRTNYDYTLRSDQSPYYGTQWNQNRYNNGPNNRNNNHWTNEYNYNNYNPNPNYWQNESGRRRDNTSSPYCNEIDKRTLSTQRKDNNTTTTARTEKKAELTSTINNKSNGESSNDTSKIPINTTNTTKGTDSEKIENSKKTECSKTIEKPRRNAVRSSPRKKLSKPQPINVNDITGDKIKLSSSSAKKKNTQVNIENSSVDYVTKNISETEREDNCSENSIETCEEQTTKKTTEQKQSLENVEKSKEQNKTIEDLADQVSKESEKNSSIKGDSIAGDDKSDNTEATQNIDLNKRASNIQNSENSQEVSKEGTINKLSKQTKNTIFDRTKQKLKATGKESNCLSDTNLEVDKPLQHTTTTDPDGISISIEEENKTDISDKLRQTNESITLVTETLSNHNDRQTGDNLQNKNSIVIGSDDENITETTTTDIPCIDIELNTSDISESREIIDEEISSLVCSVSPSKNTNPRKPKISIIPLSRLIRNELIELTDDSSVTEIEDVPSVTLTAFTPNKRICRPNLVKRRRKISTCSNSSGTTENLIEKVAGMDKFGIKQVINSCGTRFDEALKAQARKRLREEIRKQLKSMNLNTVKDAECANFVPDDIVDAICIPDIVLEEIRKAFGIEIFCNKNTDALQDAALDIIASNTQEETNTSNKRTSEANASMTTDLAPLQESIVETSSIMVQPAPDSNDTTENVAEDGITVQNAKVPTEPEKVQEINAEQVSATATKPTTTEIEDKAKEKKARRRKIPTGRKSSRKKVNKEVIRVDSSSSSSSSSTSSSSSSSDTESESSAKSTTSSVKRRRLKLRVDAQNIVESFEKLLLPNLSENLKSRYHNKFSNSTYTRLHFISCICTSEYNTKKFTKPEIAKIQSNLKSEDRTVALEFLMREIVNVFNKQKEAAKRERGSNRLRRSTEAADKPHASETPTAETTRPHETNDGNIVVDKANGISTQTVKSTCSNSNRKSANAAEKVDAAKNCIQSKPTSTTTSTTPTKHQHQSVNGQTLMSKRVEDRGRGKNAGNAETTDNAIVERHKNGVNAHTEACSNSFDSNNATNQEDSNALTLARQQPTASTTCDSVASNEQDSRNVSFESITSRTHLSESSSSSELRSPTNLRSLSRDYLYDNKFSSNGAANPLIGYENGITGLCGISGIPSMMSSTLFPNVDLEALRQRNILGEFVVNNLRDFDMKLMELHKRKMFIEEMILKLQKDKMEVDMQTMQLQNEKFLLLNTAMTAAASELPKREAAAMARTTPITPNALVQNTDATPTTPAATSSKTTDHPNQRKRKANGSNAPTVKRKRGPRKRGGVRSAGGVRNINKQPKSKSNTSTSKSSKVAETREGEVSPCTVISDLEQSLSDIEPPFDGVDMPVSTINVKSSLTQVHLYEHWLVATGEDGRLYQFNAKTLKLEKEFSKHSEAITHSYLCREKKMLYTTSLDGYMKKTSLENFALDIQSVYLQEPLQCIEGQWGSAFIGSRWGNIFTYDITSNNLNNSTISSSDVSITAIKATKEGPRRILIVASKSRDIQIRDASSGLLLRTLTLPDAMKAYSLLLDDGYIYAGTQRRDILKIDFTTGQHLSPLYCGSGAVSMRLYQNKFLLVGSYDGFVYAIDKAKERHCGRYAGCAGNILTLAVISNKVIVTAKDKTLRVIELPQNLGTKRK